MSAERPVLEKLLADADQHEECAAKANIAEARIAHSSMAAAFRDAVEYVRRDHDAAGQHAARFQARIDAARTWARQNSDPEQQTELLGVLRGDQPKDLTELRGQIDRVRAAVAERRAEVADYEAENLPSAWSDAVTVTCDRIDYALQIFPPPTGIRVDTA
ncbi:hypothetical protein ACIBEA_30005 [Streptomyces sp. NPDC051555]|uniref:hypothetical protein n=1 Tax=Streptomyces sp. NPDC051555 TaxID=3365657 RepID=UPI0037B0657A